MVEKDFEFDDMRYLSGNSFLFFTSFMILFAFFLLNMFVAIIVSHSHELSKYRSKGGDDLQQFNKKI